MALGIAVGTRAAAVGLILLTHLTPACPPLFSGLRVTSTGTPSPSKVSSSRSIGRESSCKTWHRVGASGAPKTVTYLLERLDGGTTDQPPTYGLHLTRIVHQYQRLLGDELRAAHGNSGYEASGARHLLPTGAACSGRLLWLSED